MEPKDQVESIANLNEPNKEISNENQDGEEFYYDEISKLEQMDESKPVPDTSKTEGAKVEATIEKESPLDFQALRQQLKDELKKELEEDTLKSQESLIENNRQKLLEALGLHKDTPDKEVEEILQQYGFLKEGRDPLHWKELLSDNVKVAKLVAEQTFERLLKERDEKNLVEEKELERQEAQAIKEYNKSWDEQLSILEQQGDLPVMPEDIKKRYVEGTMTEGDRNHPSIRARVLLFTLGQANNEPNLLKVYLSHYREAWKKQNKQPDGADLPISIGKQSPNNEEGEFYYDEIHNKPLYAI